MGKVFPKKRQVIPNCGAFSPLRGRLPPAPPCVRGEACVMRSSTVCCARMPNLEIAIFSGDLRRRRFPLAPPRGGLPQARQEGRPFRPCGVPSWRCPAVVTLPSRYRSTPPLKILQIFRGGKRHSFQGKHGGTCFRGSMEALVSGEAEYCAPAEGQRRSFRTKKRRGLLVQLASVSERRQLPILPGR